MAENTKLLDAEHFRDELYNLDKKGKRLWIYPKKPKGRFTNYRTLFGWFLIITLFVGPYLKLNGRPLMLFNVLDRKFIILGSVFWPQDMNLFALMMLSFVIFVVLYTVVFGRAWCGWACPQTIFLELIFRKIDYLIDGDYVAQMKLAKQPWNTEKIFKRALKHFIFFMISFFIANTFLAYIIGWDELKGIIEDGPFAHIGKLSSLIIFTYVFYFVFAHLRELVCIFICPYGRLQGLMLDKNSIVVAYDFIRGEPRGKMSKEVQEVKKGDCIDCKLCVHVCPTGIDIRNGTQLECVNCTACIDACDEVMTKIHKPKGLIRYDSLNGITSGKKLSVNARNLAYSLVLIGILSVLTYLLVTRKQVETTMLRTPGMLFQKQEDGRISNLYNIEFVNKTFERLPIQLKLVEPEGEVKSIDGQDIIVDKESIAKSSFFIIRDPSEITKINTPVRVEVWSNGKLIEVMKSNFNGPIQLKKP